MLGYMGRILRVNLTKGTSSSQDLSDEIARKFLGGRCLGAKILFEELKPGIDPLGPDNKLIVLTGPVTGTTLPGSARYVIIGKSPLTGIYGEATASGYFGPELKFAGFDGVILEGRSENPVYVWIRDGESEIRDARNLWGKTTQQAEESIRNDVSEPKARVMSIGQAGEALVRFACIVNDRNHVAGRTGLGAIMGSKNLKAIAVRGSQRVDVADEDSFMKLRKDLVARLRGDGDFTNFNKHGTAGLILPLNEQGVLPTRNFRQGVFNNAEAISGETLTTSFVVKRNTCFSCLGRCKSVCEIKEGPYRGSSLDGPEYETIAAFGSLCLNDNLPSIVHMNNLCSLYGMDTISAGNLIAFAMECYEKGILTKEMLGFELKWGDHQAMVTLVEMIALRKGFGDLLAEGVRRVAVKLGKHTNRLAVQVKGMEVPMHDPRGKKGLGLAYATSPRGACHTQASHDPGFEKGNRYPELGLTRSISRYSLDGKAEIVAKTQDLRSVINSMVVCNFTMNPDFRPVTVSDLLNLLSYTTGWSLELKSFILLGEKASNICRAFNVREGMSRSDDVLPYVFEKPLGQGPAKGQQISRNNLEQMLVEYYRLRGWNEKNGVPTQEKLVQLDLPMVASELNRLGYA